jgi:hypothetical protein
LDLQGTVRFGMYGLSGNGWEQVYYDYANQYGNPTLYPKSDGQFVIGKPSTNRVQMYAVQVWSIWFTNTSDERVKENIVPLQSSLQSIKRLRPVHYNIKKDYVSDKAIPSKQDLRKNNIGFLAQEVQKVFPDLVTQTDSAGLYGINYIEMIPIIVKAIKEQSNTIDSLQNNISNNDSLKAKIVTLDNQIATLANQVAALHSCCNANKGNKSKSDLVDETNTTTTTTPAISNAAILYQNAPNPFKELTTIKLEIPQSVGNAMVCIYDLNGRQIRCLTVSGRSTTSVQIFGNELTPGLYHYALIADGNLIDTKTMVLTE